MRKKNGFTLVEIISVIGILLLISAVAIPSIITINKRNKEKNYERIVENIKTSSENFIEEYRSDIPFNDEGKYYFRLNVLGVLELIKLPIKNPKTNEEISTDTCIEVIKNKDNTGSYDGTLSYNFIDNTTDCSNNMTTQGNTYTLRLDSSEQYVKKGSNIDLLKSVDEYSSAGTPKRYLKIRTNPTSLKTDEEGSTTVSYQVIDLLNT